MFVNDGEAPLGVCYAPIAALLEQLGKLPMLKAVVLRSETSLLTMHLSSIVSAGRCLRGSLFVPWLGNEAAFVLLTAGIVDMAAELMRGFQTTREWRDALAGMQLAAPPELTQSDRMGYSAAVRYVLAAMEKDLQPLCFHLPNAFQCTYNGDVLAMPFPEATAHSSLATVANGTALATAAASAASLAAGATAADMALQLSVAVACCWIAAHIAWYN